MPATKDSDVMAVLDSALGAFGDALRAGVKAQEEIGKWWTGAAGAVGANEPVAEWQRRSQQLFGEVAPATQKQVQELVKLLGQNYHKSIELLHKAFEVEHDGSLEGVRDRFRNLWEESVMLIRENVEAVAQANVRLIEAWSDTVRKTLAQCECKTSAASAKAK